MSYQVSWLVEKQIILAKMFDEITLESLVTMDNDLREHLRTGQADRLIHMIVDVLDVTKHPMNVAQLNQVTNARREANMGWLIIINDNQFIKFIVNIITQLTQTRFRNFQSIDEALEFLKSQDSRLDWSLLRTRDEEGLD